MGVKFCPIASSSKGNSTFVSSNNTRVLIDAGLSGKSIETGLSSIGENCENLDAIFITHEHSDHIKGAGILSRRYNIPIFATEKTWQYMDRHNKLGKVSEKNVKYVYKEENCIVNDMIITPFEISHDSIDPVGYNLSIDDFKISVATDIGVVTDNLKEKLSNSDILLLESNHDEEMVKNGSYPYILKKRILSNRGHLSNSSCGELLSSINSENLKHIFLGHLSEENNIPLLALDTVKKVLNINKACKNSFVHLADNGINKSIITL